MTSNEWASFEFNSPLDLEEISHDYVRPLENLVELAAVVRSAVLELKVVPEGGDSITQSGTVLSAGGRMPMPEPKQWFQLLFMLDHVNFAEIMPAWWKLHSEIGVIPDLLAALRDERGYVENQYLNAASAIEGYRRHRNDRVNASPEHKAMTKSVVGCDPKDKQRRLNDLPAQSHAPTFAERVDEIVDRGGPLFATAVGITVDWRNWVKSGRNGVAHRDPQMVDVDKEWRTTVRATATIQWLMTLVLLRDLGIPEDVILKGIRQQKGLEFASANLRSVRPDWFS